MGSGSDTSVDNSNASGASDKTGTESDNVVMVGGSFEKDGLKGTVNDADTDFRSSGRCLRCISSGVPPISLSPSASPAGPR